jgi:hypothetical protein
MGTSMPNLSNNQSDDLGVDLFQSLSSSTLPFDAQSSQVSKDNTSNVNSLSTYDRISMDMLNNDTSSGMDFPAPPPPSSTPSVVEYNAFTVDTLDDSDFPMPPSPTIENDFVDNETWNQPDSFASTSSQVNESNISNHSMSTLNMTTDNNFNVNSIPASMNFDDFHDNQSSNQLPMTASFNDDLSGQELTSTLNKDQSNANESSISQQSAKVDTVLNSINNEPMSICQLCLCFIRLLF